MKQVIHDLKNIHNLKHAYIYQEGEEGISTFNSQKTLMIHASIELIEQYFMAAQGIEKSYNEIIFPLDNNDNLIAFAVDDSTLVVLLTEEKINLPMLHIAITLIIKKLKDGTYQKQAVRTVAEPVKPTHPRPAMTTNATTPTTSIQPQAQAKPTPRPTPQPQAQKTTTESPASSKKPVVSSLKTLFSNPFAAKKSKSKERPYSNTQSSPTDKKLVYRE